METPINYSLRITLHKTTDPVVSRLLTIPGDMFFEELHQVIEAAFGWADEEEPYTSWVFRVCHRDPVKISNVENHGGAMTAYSTKRSKGYNITPALLHTTTQVSEMFGPANSSYGRYWTYDYGPSKHHHAIEVEGITSEDASGKIRFVKGHGLIAHKAWQFGDLRRAKDVEGQVKSTDTVDTKIEERLDSVQQAYELRKADEAGKDVPERPRKRSKTHDVKGLIGENDEALFVADGGEEGA